MSNPAAVNSLFDKLQKIDAENLNLTSPKKRRRRGVLSGDNNIFHPPSFRIAAEFREVKNVVDSFHQGGPTRLNGVQKRCLRMVEVTVVQKFSGGQDLDRKSAPETKSNNS